MGFIRKGMDPFVAATTTIHRDASINLALYAKTREIIFLRRDLESVGFFCAIKFYVSYLLVLSIIKKHESIGFHDEECLYTQFFKTLQYGVDADPAAAEEKQTPFRRI